MISATTRLRRTGFPILFAAAFFSLGGGEFTARAEVPAMLNHQGRIAVGTLNFNGTGQFKFALVSGNGATTYWSHDGTSTAGSAPASAVSLPVARGLYSVLLGDTTVSGMTALPPEVFQNTDVRLRIWFNDGTNGFQLITPDQRLAAAPWALAADSALGLLAAPAKPVVAWGNNHDGQTIVPPLANVAAVAAGENHSLALLDSGTVTAWGLNTSGQTTVPPGLTGVTAIAAGTNHSLARLSNGTISAWGANGSNQSTVPGGVTTAAKVAAGDKHSLALLANGTVLAWGNNEFQQTTVPGGLSGVSAIAAGYDHSLALKNDGTVTAWGRNEAGQTTVPSTLSGVHAIAAGAFHSLALKTDGTVTAWGWNSAGQSTVPPGLSGVTAIAAGYAFSAALKADGTVTVWGDNTDDQMEIPASTTSVTALAAGSYHLLALRAGVVPVPAARLDEDNQFTGKVGIKRAAAANTLEVEGNASKSTSGSWLLNSDRRIKTEIEPITGALEKLSRVRLVDFRYTPEYLSAHPAIEDRRYPNVIAQEFAEVFPADVKSSGETLPDGSPILQVDTYPLTIYTAAGVQELRLANEELKQQNSRLQQQLEQQEARLRKLEALLPK